MGPGELGMIVYLHISRCTGTLRDIGLYGAELEAEQEEDDDWVVEEDEDEVGLGARLTVFVYSVPRRVCFCVRAEVVQQVDCVCV